MSDKETAPWIKRAVSEIQHRSRVRGHVLRAVKSGETDDVMPSGEMEQIIAESFAVECRAPAPQPTIEQALEFINRNTFPFGDLHSTAELMVKFAAATPQVTPTELENAYMLCAGERDMWKAQYEKLAASPQVTHELELEQEAGGRWLAEFMRFPGVAAYGPSKEEAIRNAAKVLIESEPTKPSISLEVYQHDWLPGFAAFHSDGERAEGATKHIVLNVGSLLCAVESGDLPKQDLPYMIAESLMHETIHALEEWAGVEFSEERVEGLLTKYRAKYARATIWEYTGSEPKEPAAAEGTSEQASPREFKPYMEDHEYYDPPQAPPTPEEFPSRSQEKRIRTMRGDKKRLDPRASPTPDKCPSCRSKEQNTFLTPYCPDSWHYSSGTPKGSK